jgi:hypothetical protein
VGWFGHTWTDVHFQSIILGYELIRVGQLQGQGDRPVMVASMRIVILKVLRSCGIQSIF